MVIPDYVFWAIAAQDGHVGGETSASDRAKMNDWLASGGDIDDFDSEGATALNLTLVFERVDDVKWVISHCSPPSRFCPTR